MFPNPWNICIFDKSHETARPDCKLPYAIWAMCGFMKGRMSVSNEMCKKIFQTSKLELKKTEEPPPSLLLTFICVIYTDVTWDSTHKCFIHCCTQVTVLQIVEFAVTTEASALNRKLTRHLASCLDSILRHHTLFPKNKGCSKIPRMWPNLFKLWLNYLKIYSHFIQ